MEGPRPDRTFVNVPVLSEQIVLTDPSVSTVFKLLQRILFCLIIRAMIVRLSKLARIYHVQNVDTLP
jgi:hypothetical protein